jgi:capsule polysaccharide export protein KpsE/RkpR
VKQSGGIEISAHPLQEIEVPPNGNGLGEDLAEAPRHRTLDLAWLAWERRRVLWHFTLCGLILATIIAFLLPKQYLSTARLMPPEKDTGGPLAMMASMAGSGNSGGSSDSGLGQVASDLLGSKSEGALYVMVLQGRTIADSLIQRFDLRKVYGVQYWMDARKRLASHTEIAEDRKSGVIVIKVTDRDPRRAAQLAQAYVEELNRLVATVSTSAARRERIFIEQRLTSAKQDLDTAAKQFSEFASQNTAIDIPEQARAMVDAAAILQGQLIAARSDVEGLSQIYTDSNVRLRSARARVEEIQRQLVKMGGDNASFGSGGDGPIFDPSSVSKSLNPNDIYPPIRKLPLLGVRWADLYLQNKIQEKVYELLTSQYEVSKIEEAKETPSVQVYDVAEIPERKSSPPRLLIMVLGAIFSCFIGMGWIVGTKTWQEVDSHDPRKQFARHVGREFRVSALRSAAPVLDRFADSRFTKFVRGRTTELEDLRKSE